MDVTWLVDEYLGNGKVRHAAFSSKRRAVEVAERSCDHSSKVILVEWTYCRPLSAQQLFPVRTDPVVYESSSVYAISYPNIIVDNSLRKPIGFVLEDGSIS